MASNTNAVIKISNLFRSRLTLAYQLSELNKPSINQHKGKLIELLKEKAKKASQSEIAHKMRVAKGFYKLEMAPPSKDEMMVSKGCSYKLKDTELSMERAIETKARDRKKLRTDLAIMKEFMKSGCYKHLTVKQAWLIFLVGTEVALWFFLGETIGKMHIVGYKV